MAMEPSDFKGTEDARLLLEDSQRSIREMLFVFKVLSERLDGGDAVPQAELTKAITSLAGARNKLLDEVRRYEDRVLRDKKLTADSILDFDELRAELGRKLDRIRKHREAGSVFVRAEQRRD